MDRKIYIVLTDTGTVFTKLIKLYTKKPYNHASICFDSNMSMLYSFGRKKPKNPFIGGFVKESLQYGILKNAQCAIYACHVTPEQYENMLRFIHEMEAEQHLYSYNLTGVLAVPFQKKINRKKAYFCSQFVSTVLYNASVVTPTKPACFVTPHDLQTVENLQLVYQGTIAEYINAASIEIETSEMQTSGDWFGPLWRKIRSI